jgi:lipopolysaccharide biosynthesis glycosyltransferase
MQPMTDRMTVAYVCDKHYLPYLRASMASVRRYNPKVEFAVLTDQEFEVPGATVYTFNPKKELFKFNPNDRMHDGVYFKFWLPLLPYNKVLYMDCDVLCQRPLNELWNMDCEYICGTESHSYGKKQALSLGLDKYMLTGMMLMNLENLRQDNFTQKCLDRLSIESPKQHDETIINLTYHDKIKFIDVKWNYCKDRNYENPIREEDAYLLHYVSLQKKKMLKYNDFSGLVNLKDWMHNSSVAIVGNASSILEHNYGKEIDSHDIVIRFNKGFPSSKTGFKTSMVFLACTLTPAELERYAGAFLIKRSALCDNKCDFNVLSEDRFFLRQDKTDIMILQRKSHCQASTGFIAINFALSCNPRKIDLYGFDFFKTDTYYNPKGYQTMHNGDKEGEKILEYKKYGLLTIH